MGLVVAGSCGLCACVGWLWLVLWGWLLFFGSRFGLSAFVCGEFDPGSGRTLAACLTHASRTGSVSLCAGWG